MDKTVIEDDWNIVIPQTIFYQTLYAVFVVLCFCSIKFKRICEKNGCFSKRQFV